MKTKILLIIFILSILFYSYYKFIFLNNTIIGNWHWLKPTNHLHSMMYNGIAICYDEPLGVWEKVNKNQIYSINWENKWIDKVILINDFLIGINSNNKIIIAYRIK